jgi:hypothetical protein
MRIIHRIAVHAGRQEQRELASLGVEVVVGIALFEVDESHPSWPALARWIAAREVSDNIRTEFTEHDLDAATWFELGTVCERGYPQPEKSFRSVTYDLSAHCSNCGVGRVQKAPFRMKGEQRWVKNGIMRLHWVHDEYFVAPEVWRDVLKPLGIGARPVLSTRGKELERVVQLVSCDDEVNVSLEGCAYEVCGVCNRVRYDIIQRGHFPPLRSEPRGHLVRTAQPFGSGAYAYHPVLISQACYRALRKHKVQGAVFTPVSSATPRLVI